MLALELQQNEMKPEDIKEHIESWRQRWEFGWDMLFLEEDGTLCALDEDSA